MILIDHTEARTTTKLPASVVNASVICVGLESMTGADILITPKPKPVLTHVSDTPYSINALKIHTNAGMLIQRKHGADLTSSIADLKEVQQRMLEWTGAIGPWLLTVGEYRNSKGRFFIDGKVVRGGVGYNQYLAALDVWQLRGGGITNLPSDSMIPGWINAWHERLLSNGANDRAFIPAQKLVLTEDWWSRLTMLPDVGLKKAEAIKDWLPPEWRTLGLALCALTDSGNIELLKVGKRPAGVGVKTLESVREFLGMTQDEVLTIRRKNNA